MASPDTNSCRDIKSRGVFPEMKFYMLKTVNIVRKYIGLVDALLTTDADFVYFNFNLLDSVRAMKQHASQFVWFRWLFVLFSRYSYINSLEVLS